MSSRPGMLIVFSGPSGVGKGTLLQSFLMKNPNVAYSVSATTRKPRASEVDGVSYHFISKEEFEKRLENGLMLEYALYNDNYYGTPKDEVLRQIQNGKDVLLEIEVQGAVQIREKWPDALFIFVTPPSFGELRRRIAQRGSEDDASLKYRLETARRELAVAGQYDYIIINDRVDDAAEDLAAIIRAAKCRKKYMESFLKEVSVDA